MTSLSGVTGMCTKLTPINKFISSLPSACNVHRSVFTKHTQAQVLSAVHGVCKFVHLCVSAFLFMSPLHGVFMFCPLCTYLYAVCLKFVVLPLSVLFSPLHLSACFPPAIHGHQVHMCELILKSRHCLVVVHPTCICPPLCPWLVGE